MERRAGEGVTGGERQEREAKVIGFRNRRNEGQKVLSMRCDWLRAGGKTKTGKLKL